MTKRRSSKRGKRTQQRHGLPGEIQTADTPRQVPSAPTLFRFHVLDPETMKQMDKATEILKPLLWMRDGGSVRQIRQARTAEELIDLLPQSGGACCSSLG